MTQIFGKKVGFAKMRNSFCGEGERFPKEEFETKEYCNIVSPGLLAFPGHDPPQILIVDFMSGSGSMINDDDDDMVSL